jgi:hypothetical protein
LATHNAVWQNYTSSYPVANFALIGGGVVQVVANPFNSAGALLGCSTSDTFQIVLQAASSTANFNLAKYGCVRAQSGGTSGYCGSPCFSDGSGNWGRVCIFKNGSLFFQSGLSSYVVQANHTLKITASGTSTVTLNLFMDGTNVGTTTDSSSPIASGHPMFYMGGDGTNADNQFGAVQDH